MTFVIVCFILREYRHITQNYGIILSGVYNMDKIQPINSIDTLEVYKILTSSKLTDTQKAQFIKKNSVAIKKLTKTDITQNEFKELMSHRPLIRFRPLKNSFTKQGDDVMFAKSVGITKKEIRKYINSIIDNNFENQHFENIEKAKAYVYRHGTKAQVISFLEYELSDVKTTLQKLYKTLEYNSGGLADYFSRPIHRMDNITLGKLYTTIDKSLKNLANAGYINHEDLNTHAEWALVKIYEIQNNSKLIRACELYNDLSSC